MGDEFGGLYAVHQQLQFRQLEIPARDIIACVSPVAGFDNVKAEVAERFKIVIEAFALCSDVVPCQLLRDLAPSGGVALVRVLQQILHHIEDFQLLIGGTRHLTAPCPMEYHKHTT